LKKTQIN